MTARKPKRIRYDYFIERLVPQYFKPVHYDVLEKDNPTIIEYFERRSQMYLAPTQYVKGAALNIVTLNMEEFLKKVKNKFKFLETLSEDVQVFLFEYVKPYYRTSNVPKFEHAELLVELCIYSKKENKIIAHLESREGIVDFTPFFSEPFVGFIETNREYRQQGIATFMLRAMSFYLWLRRRKTLHSGTLVSPEMLNVYRALEKKTKWIVRKDYLNEYEEKPRERYYNVPIKLNVIVTSSDQEFLM